MGGEPAFRESMQIMGGRELSEDSFSGFVGQLEETSFQITRTIRMTLRMKFKKVPQGFRTNNLNLLDSDFWHYVDPGLLVIFLLIFHGQFCTRISL